MSTIIETERLILRKFCLEDAEAVYEFGSNEYVNLYTGDTPVTSVEKAKKLITSVWFKDYKTYGYGRWAVIYKPENKIIGFAGLKYLPEFDKTDIGFRFLPAYWGKGIATEVSKEIITYGFNVLKLSSIYGIAMPENIGSCKVLEKIGFQFYKTDDYDGDGEIYNWYKLHL